MVFAQGSVLFQGDEILIEHGLAGGPVRGGISAAYGRIIPLPVQRPIRSDEVSKNGVSRRRRAVGVPHQGQGQFLSRLQDRWSYLTILTIAQAEAIQANP